MQPIVPNATEHEATLRALEIVLGLFRRNTWFVILWSQEIGHKERIDFPHQISRETFDYSSNLGWSWTGSYLVQLNKRKSKKSYQCYHLLKGCKSLNCLHSHFDCSLVSWHEPNVELDTKFGNENFSTRWFRMACMFWGWSIRIGGMDCLDVVRSCTWFPAWGNACHVGCWLLCISSICGLLLAAILSLKREVSPTSDAWLWVAA